MLKRLIETNPLPLAILLSIALSLCLGWDALINTDGVLYLRAATAFASGDYHKAFELYPWGFYTSLIAMMAKLTGASMEHAAVILNALLYGVMIAGFLAVVKKMGGDRLTLWLAAATMLASPALNDFREDIIRDFGQWAFMPWALYFYMCAYERVTLRAAFGWTLSIGLAFLFRIEAIALIALAPGMLIFLQNNIPYKTRFIHAAKLYAMTILLAILGMSALIASDHLGMVDRFASLSNVAQYMVQDLGKTYMQHATTLAKDLSMFMPRGHAAIILAGGFLVYLIYEIIYAINLVYLVLAGATLSKGYVPERQFNRCVWLFIALYLMTILQHLSQQYFLTKRYLMPIAICFMFWVPFALRKIANTRQTWQWLTAVVMIYLFISGITHFGHDKSYLKNPGIWIDKHAKPNVRIVSNSRHVLYYTHRQVDWDRDHLNDANLMSIDFNSVDYVVMCYHHYDDDLKAWLAAHDQLIVARYENKRHDGSAVLMSHPTH